MKLLLKTLALFAALTGLLTAATPEKPKPLNIGFAVYTKGAEPGTLQARWNYANLYHGPGVATGGPKEGFAGRYHIRYYLETGEFSDEYDLVIEKTGDFYTVSWFVDGKLSARGVGMEVDHRLAVGWRRIED